MMLSKVSRVVKKFLGVSKLSMRNAKRPKTHRNARKKDKKQKALVSLVLSIDFLHAVR